MMCEGMESGVTSVNWYRETDRRPATEPKEQQTGNHVDLVSWKPKELKVTDLF